MKVTKLNPILDLSPRGAVTRGTETIMCQRTPICQEWRIMSNPAILAKLLHCMEFRNSRPQAVGLRLQPLHSALSIPEEDVILSEAKNLKAFMIEILDAVASSE